MENKTDIQSTDIVPTCPEPNTTDEKECSEVSVCHLNVEDLKAPAEEIKVLPNVEHEKSEIKEANDGTLKEDVSEDVESNVDANERGIDELKNLTMSSDKCDVQPTLDQEKDVALCLPENKCSGDSNVKAADESLDQLNQPSDSEPHIDLVSKEEKPKTDENCDIESNILHEELMTKDQATSQSAEQRRESEIKTELCLSPPEVATKNGESLYEEKVKYDDKLVTQVEQENGHCCLLKDEREVEAISHKVKKEKDDDVSYCTSSKVEVDIEENSKMLKDRQMLFSSKEEVRGSFK